MAEEAPTPDVKEDLSFEEELAQVEAETTESEPSTEENKAEATTEDEEPSEGKETEGNEEDKEADEATEDESETEETQTEKPTRAEVRKEQISNEIREKLAQSQQLDREIAAKHAQIYRPQTPEEIMAAAEEKGEDISGAQAEIQALRQEREVEKYTNHVTQLTTTLEREALEVARDYQVFDSKSTEYNPQLAELAADVYRNVAGIQQDPQTGMVYQANATPYPVFEAVAKAYQAGAQSGKVSGQRATEKMLSAAETPSSSAPKPQKEDAFGKALAEEFDKL